MAIDASGRWWKGSVATDLDEYLRDYSAGGYKPDRVVYSACACGGMQFRLEVDDDAGVARRTCQACGVGKLMLDSAGFIEEAEPDECACPCGGEVFDVAVAFAHREDKSVKWVAVGARCIACGVLGAYADWKIDYDPTDHLYVSC